MVGDRIVGRNMESLATALAFLVVGFWLAAIFFLILVYFRPRGGGGMDKVIKYIE
jgi:hypothetical protein